MKTTIVIALVALLTAGMAWAHQQKDGFDSSNRTERMIEKVTQRLELDEVQQQKLQHFADAMTQRREEHKGERKSHRQELMGLLDDPTLDRAKALELMDEKHRRFKESMGSMVDAFADFSDSLDAGQREQLKELVAKRMEHRRGGRHWAH